MKAIESHANKLRNGCIFWALCIAGGGIATVINVPSGWMIGAMLAAIVVNLRAPRGTFTPVPKGSATPMNIAQLIIALLAAYPCSQSDLRDLISALPLAVLLTICTAATCYAVASFLHKKTQSEWHTCFLSLLPGGASSMAALAFDLKANIAYVAFVQYLRVIIVSLSIPLVALAFGEHTPSAEQVAFGGTIYSWLMILAAFILGTGVKKCFPHFAAAFLIPVVLVAAVIAILLPQGMMPTVPTIAKIYAYVFVGAIAGSKIDRAALRTFAHSLHWIVWGIFLVLLMTAAFAGVMYLTHYKTALDAYLATVPGAIYIVFGFAADSANGGFIVVMQIFRMLSVITLAGMIPWIVARRIAHQSKHG